MEEWYRDVGVMREDVQVAFDEAVEEAGGLVEDEVNSEPHSGSDGDDMAMSDDK